MTGSRRPEDAGQLDPAAQTIVAVIGPKGSGKSKYIRYLASTYPHDQIVIDLHGVDAPAELGVRDSGVVRIDHPPARWPEHLRPRPEVPLVLYYQPDAGSPTLLADMDDAAGLAYVHGRCLLLIHEWGEVGIVHRTPPMTRRVLSQGRGRKVSLLLAMHRPHNIDPMTLVQADVIVVFGASNPRDRDYIANAIGWEPADFDLAVRELEPYGYLQYDRRVPPPAPGEPDLRLLHYPPLTEQELRAALHPERARVQHAAL